MQRHGWTLLFHACVVEQLRALHGAAERAERADPAGAATHHGVERARALSRLILETVPSDPSRDEFAPDGRLGPVSPHWRRARAGGLELFFRYDARARVVVFVWLHDGDAAPDEDRLSHRYAVFRTLLGRDTPPADWATLAASSLSGRRG